MWKSLLSGAIATKVIASAASAAAIGGIALAASSGHLGNATDPGASAPGRAVASAHQTLSPDEDSTATATSPAGDATSVDSVSSSTSSSASGTPAVTARTQVLAGLCQAWRAHEHNPANRGKWQQAPAFGSLVSAAGTQSGVDSFCITLIGPTPSTTPTTSPTMSQPTPADTSPSHPAHPTQAHTSPSHPAHPTQAHATPSHPAHPTQAGRPQ